MKIAIAGGNGFLGARVVKEFVDKGDSVNILTRTKGLRSNSDKISYYVGDLTNIDSLKPFLEGCDFVCNCAGEFTAIENMEMVNFTGLKNLFNTAREYNITKFMQVSSVGVYGFRRTGFVAENAALKGENAYENSKIQADKWLLNRVDNKGIVILRPSIIFGEDMKNTSLKSLVEVIRKTRFFFIGRKGAIANYIYVGNVAKAIVNICHLSMASKCKIYNISDSVSLERFVEIICEITGSQYPRFRMPKIIVIFIAYILDLISRLSGKTFPLTISRINALTSNALYKSDLLREDIELESMKTLEDSLYLTIKSWGLSKPEN